MMPAITMDAEGSKFQLVLSPNKIFNLFGNICHYIIFVNPNLFYFKLYLSHNPFETSTYSFLVMFLCNLYDRKK